MWYFIVIISFIIGIVFTSTCFNKNSENGSESTNHILINSVYSPNDTIKAMFSKKQIDEKLKRLAETPPPEKLATGAMCYKVAFETHINIEYVCPICGEKTIYKKEKHPDQSWLIQNLERNINSCRNEIENVKGINIKLDESQFCNKCSPNFENPQLGLLINIAGQSDTTKIYGINKFDIQLIHEFLTDKLVHLDDYDFETPLKDKIDRIKELLGLNRN